MDQDRGPWFTTYTGKRFYLADPTPEEVDPRDIVHATARLCRFNGHCREFYSVAQHLSLAFDAALLLGHGVDSNVARWAVLHDAAEAYVGDMIRPIKYFLDGRYREIEKAIDRAIETRFGLELSDSDRAFVKSIDHVLLFTEARALMPLEAVGTWSDQTEGFNLPVEPWKPLRAEFELGRRLGKAFLGRGF